MNYLVTNTTHRKVSADFHESLNHAFLGMDKLDLKVSESLSIFFSQFPIEKCLKLKTTITQYGKYNTKYIEQRHQTASLPII